MKTQRRFAPTRGLFNPESVAGLTRMRIQTNFCCQAVREALEKGRPEYFTRTRVPGSQALILRRFSNGKASGSAWTVKAG